MHSVAENYYSVSVNITDIQWLVGLYTFLCVEIGRFTQQEYFAHIARPLILYVWSASTLHTHIQYASSRL